MAQKNGTNEDNFRLEAGRRHACVCDAKSAQQAHTHYPRHRFLSLPLSLALKASLTLRGPTLPRSLPGSPRSPHRERVPQCSPLWLLFPERTSSPCAPLRSHKPNEFSRVPFRSPLAMKGSLKVKLQGPTLSRSHIKFLTTPQHLARSPMFPVRAPIH